MVFDLFFLLCDSENDLRVKSCAVGMCNAILGNDLKVARIIDSMKENDGSTLCKDLLVLLIYMMIWRGCT